MNLNLKIKRREYFFKRNNIKLVMYYFGILKYEGRVYFVFGDLNFF